MERITNLKVTNNTPMKVQSKLIFILKKWYLKTKKAMSKILRIQQLRKSIVKIRQFMIKTPRNTKDLTNNILDNTIKHNKNTTTNQIHMGEQNRPPHLKLPYNQSNRLWMKKMKNINIIGVIKTSTKQLRKKSLNNLIRINTYRFKIMKK